MSLRLNCFYSGALLLPLLSHNHRQHADDGFLDSIRFDSIQIIPITIPRVFYVNCMEDKGPAGGSTMGRRVARTLPNGHASPFLHEVAMDEAKFQRNEKQVHTVLAAAD